MTLRGWLVPFVLLLCSPAVEARAQNVPGQPNRQPPVRPGVRDTTRRADTTRARTDSTSVSDTTGVANFLPPDSVMQRLLELPGFSVTR